MLQKDKTLRNQTIILSVFVSLIITVGFALHEYRNLKSRINTDVLPSIAKYCYGDKLYRKPYSKSV